MKFAVSASVTHKKCSWGANQADASTGGMANQITFTRAITAQPKRAIQQLENATYLIHRPTVVIINAANNVQCIDLFSAMKLGGIVTIQTTHTIVENQLSAVTFML